jgi:hypothetical protein
MIAKKTWKPPWEISHLVICRGRSRPREAAYGNTARVYINHTHACLNHTRACVNQARVCGNHNFACKNHSLRVEIALCMYTLHSCMLKSHFACRNHNRACEYENWACLSKNIFKNLYAKVSFSHVCVSNFVVNYPQQNLKTKITKTEHEVFLNILYAKFIR